MNFFLATAVFLVIAGFVSAKYDAAVVEDTLHKFNLILKTEVSQCLSKNLTTEQTNAFEALKAHATDGKLVEDAAAVNSAVLSVLRRIPAASKCPVADINTGALAEVLAIFEAYAENWEQIARSELTANGIDALEDAIAKFRLILEADASKCLSNKLTTAQTQAFSALKAHTKGSSLSADTKKTVLEVVGRIPVGSKCPVGGLNANAISALYDIYAANPTGWEADAQRAIDLFQLILDTDLSRCVSSKLTSAQQSAFAALKAHADGVPLNDVNTVRKVVVDTLKKIPAHGACPLAGADVGALEHVFDVYAATPVPAKPAATHRGSRRSRTSTTKSSPRNRA